MASSERWYFDLEQIHSTPSIKCGYDHDKELSCRQQAANFIQDMGQRLQVNQLCINTAIVYMHRFYMFHSFQRFHRTSLASASLFLAAKVEEQPRKLEHVIRFAQICLHRDQMPFDVTSQAYMEQVQDLIMNENILLQTLGFDVAIDHPHTHIVRCCQLVRASKDLAQTSYFMASYSLHLTTMCLQYKPTVVACFCIHLACKWSNWEIPESSEGRPWFWYVDKSVTSELLESLTAEFLNLFEKCPSRLKKKIMALSSYSNIPSSISNAPQQGPPTQIPMSQAEIDKKKESRLAVESHNPMNSVPLPIGPLGVAVAEANSLQAVQTHPLIHQNPIVARHNICSENLMKKHHYEHAGTAQRTQIVGPPPPSIPIDQQQNPYKKLHHPPHHQRESHSMGMQGGAKLPSCMFDVGVVPPVPPHKTYPQHVQPPAVHPAASRTTNHVPTAHRPPSRPHVRNGEAHYPDKKLPLEMKPVETKPTQVVAPSIQVAARNKPKTPPNQLSLEPVVPQVKMERSIFSPEEKACSPPPPPPAPAPTRIHEKPKICSPPTPVVVVKKESPHIDPATLPQASGALPPHDTRPSTHPSLNPGDAASRERVATGVPLPAPDTPSKSSHAKKKKKKHKEHKDKHKDKHKHKHRVKDPEPIVITIPKEKITISHPEGLKIKIAKEKISAPPAATTGLKLKISKDKLKKRERGSGGEEDDVQQPSKQHRPNGTAVLQVTQSYTFSSVLGKSILSPIRTPNFSNKYDSSPQNSPSHIPKYSPTQSGDCKPPLCVKTPGRHDPVYSPRSSPTNPCLSPIAATPRYSSPPSRSLSTLDKSHSTLEGDPAVSPLRSKPFLSPIAATPRHTSSTKQFKSPPHIETSRSQVTELSHMSPIQSKPFLSPIAATPRHVPKIKNFKSPFMARGDISHSGDSEMPHMSPIKSKPFLSPLAPTPRHSSKTKTFKSPPANHVYVPLARPRSRPVELPHMSPVQSKPFLSPIAPTPRYPSPKQKNSPPPNHCYIPITETEESSASSVSPVSSTHSSLEHSDYEEENKVSSPVQFCSSPKISRVEQPLSTFSPDCDQDYREDKKLLSPIQTPAYVPETIGSPLYVPKKVYESPVGQEEPQSPLYKEEIQSPHHSSDKLGSPTSSSEAMVSPEGHRYDSDSGSTSKTYSEKHSNYNSDKESMPDDNLMADSGMDDFSKSSPLDTSSHSPVTSELDKEQVVSCKSPSPDPKTDDNIQDTPVYEEYRPYGKNIDCSSPLGTLENGGKSLLSPIMTPGRSPVRGESPEGKPTSPAIVPRYSPTDPNSFGCEPTGINEQNERSTDRIKEASPSGKLRKGPHTPPSPLQHYDPITPARPDPNEIIFKDSNDNHTVNHTQRSSPGLLKKPYDRRCDEDRPYQRKPPLLPDFKIPRTTNRPRRHPGQDSIGPWPNRGRGRGGHFYPRSRGRGARFELPPGQHHYRHPHRMPSHYEHDRGRAFFHRGQDMQRYEPAPPDHQVQRFDPSLVLQGNAYDAAIMKHAYETMGVPPEYFMHQYHQVYIPAYPPPPPLPDEPPPQPPPPPPPHL